jgi:hypothetical protein
MESKMLNGVEFENVKRCAKELAVLVADYEANAGKMADKDAVMQMASLAREITHTCVAAWMAV